MNQSSERHYSMRAVLIGAVGSTEIVLRAMQEAGNPPILLATLAPEIGPTRHADYVNLAAQATTATKVLFVERTDSCEFIRHMRELSPDIMLIIGWSQIIGPELRAVARYGCVGFHPSLLPALRGRAVIGWTILLGLRETGVTLFQISDGVDDGPIFAQKRIALDERENISTLVGKLSIALGQMIKELLPLLINGEAKATVQSDKGVSYCARRTAVDSLIDWRAGRESIDRLIRASSPPYAGAFTFTRKRKVLIWEAELWQQRTFHAAEGQIVDYVDGDPIVNCGNGEYLRITHYDAGDKPLAGQIRFQDSLRNEEHAE
jgi:methionyl-tRNA formyltransferase